MHFLKSFPKRENIECVYLYETAPVKKITGFFVWNDFVTLYFFEPIAKEYKNLPHSTRNIVSAGCVPFEDLKKYNGDGIKLFGWKIEKPQKYKEPLPLSMFNFERPPQSWCYDWSDLPF